MDIAFYKNKSTIEFLPHIMYNQIYIYKNNKRLTGNTLQFGWLQWEFEIQWNNE